MHACRSTLEDPTDARILIGKPGANVQAYVVDERLQLCATGVIGELLIGGDGVGRGYLRRQELTEERFVQDHFRGSGTLYRTGDLARWTASGELEFLGRRDAQVKLRGYRIEVGEIEHAARAVEPGLREVAVVVQNGSELVCYVVPGSAPAAALPERLRAALAERLPSYMVPSRCVVLERLPLTTNGKLDLRALPSPQRTPARSGATRSADPLEALVRSAFERVLGRGDLAADSDFHALGGDSIKALQVASRLKQAGVSCEARDVLKSASLGALVETLAARKTHAAAAASGPFSGPLPLAPIQRWFFEALARGRCDGAADHFNQTVELRWKERADEAALRRAMSKLVAHHDMLRARYTTTDGVITQSVDGEASEVHFEVHDLTRSVPRQAESLVAMHMANAERSLSLRDGRLIAGQLLRLPNEDRVVLTAHHLVVDGVSWRVLLEDLATAYASGTLPARTSSYARWSATRTETAAAYELTPQIEATMARLPRDFAVDEVVWGDCETLPLDWSAATTAQLRATPGARFGDLLVAAMARAVTAWCGVERPVLCLEGHGREDPTLDLTRTVGWFTSMFPFVASADPHAVAAGLRDVPGHGVPGRLVPPILHNYLGDLGELAGPTDLFRARPSLAPSAIAPSLRHPFDVEVVLWLEAGALRGALTYPKTRYREATIRRLASALTEATEALAAAPAGFTYQGLSVDDLDQLFQG